MRYKEIGEFKSATTFKQRLNAKINKTLSISPPELVELRVLKDRATNSNEY